MPGTEADVVTSLVVETPEQAIRWVRVALRTLVSALLPEEAAMAHEWLDLAQRESTERLRDGEPFAFSLSQGDMRVEWTARRVSFLPLAYRVSGAQPFCVEQYAEALKADSS